MVVDTTTQRRCNERVKEGKGRKGRQESNESSQRKSRQKNTHTLTSARQKLIELTAQLPVREEEQRRRKKNAKKHCADIFK